MRASRVIAERSEEFLQRYIQRRRTEGIQEFGPSPAPEARPLPDRERQIVARRIHRDIPRCYLSLMNPNGARGVNELGSLVRIHCRLDRQRYAHDQSGDNSQSHISPSILTLRALPKSVTPGVLADAPLRDSPLSSRLRRPPLRAPPSYSSLKVSCSRRHRSIDSILKRQSLPTLNAGRRPRLSCR